MIVDPTDNEMSFMCYDSKFKDFVEYSFPNMNGCSPVGENIVEKLIESKVQFISWINDIDMMIDIAREVENGNKKNKKL